MAGDNMKTYIVVTPFFPTPDSYRGCFVLDAVKALKRNSDYRVGVFVPYQPGKPQPEYEVNGITVHRFPMLQMPSYFFNGLSNGLNGRLFVKALEKAGIKPSDVSVCHAHTSVFGALALALKRKNPKIKTLLQHHDLDPYTIRNGKLASWLPNLYYRASAARKVAEKIDLHVCISKAVERNLRHFPELNPQIHFEPYNSKLRKLKRFRTPAIKASGVLYNGVNTAVFNASGRTGHDGFRIGCIANFQDLKDYSSLLKALKLLRDKGIDFQAELVGSGGELQGCKTFVEDNGMQNMVTFVAEMPHDKLADFYRSLDLFVLPSAFEGLGCVYTEAWSCGTPFIACQGQGIADYIYPEDAHLWLAKPGDYKDLAAKIEYYIQNRQQQRLCHPVDIDVLMKAFIQKLQ